MALPGNSSQSLSFKYIMPPFVWALLIFISSSIPGTELPPLDVWSADKFLHSFVYGALAFLSGRAFIHYGSVKNKGLNGLIIRSALLCLLYGISDEFHQTFVPNRFASVYDLLADGFGIVVVHMYFWLKKK
jgi:VanZ family protein